MRKQVIFFDPMVGADFYISYKVGDGEGLMNMCGNMDMVFCSVYPEAGGIFMVDDA